MPPRDIEWLSAFCCDPGLGQEPLASELCGLAVKRFCSPFPPPSRWELANKRKEATVSERSAPWLIKALLATGQDHELARVIRFIHETPFRFSLAFCQVPALKELVPWSKQRLQRIHPQLAAWLADVRHQLESATARRPEPPRDWSRPAEVDCGCRFCQKLNTFLANPTLEVERIAANEDRRRHLISLIGEHQCDVQHTLERRGSPFSLVLTKTSGSFQRAEKKYEDDLRLLGELP